MSPSNEPAAPAPNHVTSEKLESLSKSICRDLGVEHDYWPIVYNPLASIFGLPTVERPRVAPSTPSPENTMSSVPTGSLSGSEQANQQQEQIDTEDRASGALDTRDAGTGQIADSAPNPGSPVPTMRPDDAGNPVPITEPDSSDR